MILKHTESFFREYREIFNLSGIINILAVDLIKEPVMVQNLQTRGIGIFENVIEEKGNTII